MSTYNDVSTVQLGALCNALGLETELQSYTALQRFLFDPWGDYDIPARPAYASDIGDDHSPFEYSIALGSHGVELRILFETQAARPSLHSNHEAALALNGRLEKRFGTDLRRFERVRELFAPGDVKATFSLWHAVCLNPGRSPAFKIYLNPQVRGAAAAHDVLREALRRLGFQASAYRLLRRAAWRGLELDELKYFSLDLSDGAEARVKVYFCHHRATAADVERSFEEAPSHRAGDVAAFCRHVVGQEGPFSNKPVSSCFAFVGGSDVPKAVTFHHPVAHYVQHDAATMRQVSDYLTSHNMNASVYARALRAIAHRPLHETCGTQSYASFRRETGGTRFTAYLSPELYRGRMSYWRGDAGWTGERAVPAMP